MTLKVLGAGFGRTGTMSMKAALEQLGFGPCYHMVECMPRGPDHWRMWIDALEGRSDWEQIFAGFGATVDFPACTSYAALASHFPDAKVVLTVRDADAWFDSTQETIFAPHWIEHLRHVELGRFMQLTINDYFQDRMHERQHLTQRYREHVEQVRRTVPADRLLEFDVKDGWAPLCEFLGVPIPAGDFPFINDTEATQEIIRRIIAEGPDAVFGYTGR